jgi:hypothetical protein
VVIKALNTATKYLGASLFIAVPCDEHNKYKLYVNFGWINPIDTLNRNLIISVVDVTMLPNKVHLTT